MIEDGLFSSSNGALGASELEDLVFLISHRLGTIILKLFFSTFCIRICCNRRMYHFMPPLRNAASYFGRSLMSPRQLGYQLHRMLVPANF